MSFCSKSAAMQRKPSACKKIEYVADGCARQYKNFKKFSKLCYHQSGINLMYLGNFCDKSEKVSLWWHRWNCEAFSSKIKFAKQPNSNSQKFVWFLSSWYPKQKMLFYTSNATEKACFALQGRYKMGTTVKGTRSSHCFEPLPQNGIHFKQPSEDPEFSG